MSEDQVPLPVVEVTGPEAMKMAHLLGLYFDLSDSRANCEMLILEMDRNGNGIIGGRGDTLTQALYTAAVISYSRVFVSGKRMGVAEQVLADVAPEALFMHRYFRKVRDQHVAHSVLPFETVKVGVVMNSPTETEAKILGVGHLAIRRTTDEKDGILKLIGLVDILSSKVAELIAAQEERVIAEAALIGAEQLRGLPVLAIFSPTVDVDAGPPKN